MTAAEASVLSAPASRVERIAHASQRAEQRGGKRVDGQLSNFSRVSVAVFLHCDSSRVEYTELLEIVDRKP
jgi:hypothetical protein